MSVFWLGSFPIFGQKLIRGEGGAGDNKVLVYTFEKKLVEGGDVYFRIES